MYPKTSYASLLIRKTGKIIYKYIFELVKKHSLRLSKCFMTMEKKLRNKHKPQWTFYNSHAINYDVKVDGIEFPITK